MQKGCMLKLMSVVALLILAPATDAAPITSDVPDLQQASLRGDKKPKDPWTSGSDNHNMTTHFDGQEMTVPVRPLDSLDKVRSQTLKIASVPVDSDGLDNIVVAGANSLDSQHNTGSVIDDPEIEEHIATEKSHVHKPLKLIPPTVNSNKQSKTLLATKPARVSASSTTDRREKILQMLIALEELHRSLNSTLKSHLTIIRRGNSNSRSSGKKSKMLTEGNMKSTTVPSLVSNGASSRASTDQVDPKLLNGKAFKKSLSSTPKKTNKRVCFWKYCSQN